MHFQVVYFLQKTAIKEWKLTVSLGKMTMGFSDHCTLYEDLRKRNMQRNEEVMRNLGLLPPRSNEEGKSPPLRKVRKRKEPLQRTNDLRRSQRIAALLEKASVISEVRGSENSVCSTLQGDNIVRKRRISRQAKDKEMENKMEPTGISEDAYSTDASTDSLYAVEVNLDSCVQRSVHDGVLDTRSSQDVVGSMSHGVNVDAVNTDVAAVFAARLQEFLMLAVQHATTPTTSGAAGMSSVSPNMCQLNPEGVVDQVVQEKTWSERTYNVVKARKNRQPHMTRTSAGEGSESEKEFVAPDNETPQQRSVRSRRLNRFRAKRSKELTSNRKAVKKLPYVIHIDGMAKARGIHKHLWRAAVRGQCGRLDPTMDNINHHPKQVVDSIWHALEKEWEFQGFAHRAREMFERSATKFMRNRKMQLKYKSQKIMDGSKPEDVRGKHWSKIVDLTKTVTKQSMSDSCPSSSAKGKEIVQASQTGVLELLPHGKNGEMRNDKRSGTSDVMGNVTSESDTIAARIRSLQSELLRLQKSREIGFVQNEVPMCTISEDMDDDKSVYVMEEGVEVDKENKVPSTGTSVQWDPKSSLEKNAREDEVFNGNAFRVAEEMKTYPSFSTQRAFHEEETREELKQAEMDCGDVVKVYAFTGGRREEIGRGILMGLAGSKYARKVIPKGWRSIKLTTCTSAGASKICPLPTGWTESSKYQTVAEANGRTILWPHMLLMSLQGV